MKKEDCFEIFNEHLDYFNYPAEDFELLENIEDLNDLDDYDVLRVTPLLNEIFHYALIYTNLDIFYIQGLADDDRDDLYKDIGIISSTALNYMLTLFDEEVKHPSVLRCAYMQDGRCEYEIMLDELSTIKNKTDVNSESLFGKVFDKIDIDNSKSFGYQINDIVYKLSSIDDKKELMHYLSAHAFAFGCRKLLFLNDDYDGIISNYNPETEEYFCVRKVADDKYLKLVELFALLEMVPSGINGELESLIDDAKDHYMTFKLMQYQYYKNTHIEGKMLEKI